MCLTKRALLKHFVCFIGGVKIKKKDDAFIILPDISLINLSREVRPCRSGNLARHDCLALLAGQWCNHGPDREDFCGRNRQEETCLVSLLFVYV